MDKHFYRDLMLLINDKDKMGLRLEYSSARIAHYHALLENEKDRNRVLEFQGAIKELRRIKTLRDEVIAGAK